MDYKYKLLRLPAALGTALMLMTSAPSIAPAQMGASDFTGTYELAMPKEKARELIDQNIDTAVEDMFFAFKGTARSRLSKSTNPCKEIAFDINAQQITSYCDDRVPSVSPADGSTTTYVNNEGEEYVLAQKVSNGRLTQVYGADDGLRRNVYELGPNGEVVSMSATLESDKLSEPLTYDLEYARVSDTPPQE